VLAGLSKGGGRFGGCFQKGGGDGLPKKRQRVGAPTTGPSVKGKRVPSCSLLNQDRLSGGERGKE